MMIISTEMAPVRKTMALPILLIVPLTVRGPCIHVPFGHVPDQVPPEPSQADCPGLIAWAVAGNAKATAPAVVTASVSIVTDRTRLILLNIMISLNPGQYEVYDCISHQ